MNLFRQTPDRSLDRKYLRVCAVYRLMKRGMVAKDRALVLLAQKHSPTEMKALRGTVELWLSGPLKNGGCACTSLDRSHCRETNCGFAA